MGFYREKSSGNWRKTVGKPEEITIFNGKTLGKPQEKAWENWKTLGKTVGKW